MKVYRIVRSEYKDDLSGYGAFLYGGRWNNKGRHAVYGAEHISLAVLEIVVNYDRASTSLLPEFALIEIEMQDDEIVEIDQKVLKSTWDRDTEYTRVIGDEFLRSQSCLALKVPSAVIPEESNFILNPLHQAFKKVKITGNRIYGLDNRLF